MGKMSVDATSGYENFADLLKIIKPGTAVKFSPPAEHQRKVWHIRGIVDQEAVIATWNQHRGGYTYFTKWLGLIAIYYYDDGWLKPMGKSRGNFPCAR